jgi:circadian clock protein KaiB
VRKQADIYVINTGLGAFVKPRKYTLKLYVTDHTASSQQAIFNIKSICGQELDNEYELEVIDVLQHPQLAEDEKIIATPTLIRELPLPLRRIIGDLSERDKVLLGLDLVNLEQVKKKA